MIDNTLKICVSDTIYVGVPNIGIEKQNPGPAYGLVFGL